MEEDAPLLGIGIADFASEAQAMAVRHFEAALLAQKAIIRDLETRILSS